MADRPADRPLQWSSSFSRSPFSEYMECISLIRAGSPKPYGKGEAAAKKVIDEKRRSNNNGKLFLETHQLFFFLCLDDSILADET